MPTYVEYSVDDGSTILIEAEDAMGGVVRASHDGANVVRAGKKFTDALASVRGSLRALVNEMDAMKVEEAEIKFGLKTLGEAGIFAVGKVGGEINYEITLKWKKPVEEEKVRGKK